MSNDIREWLRLCERSEAPLPDDVVRAFQALGSAQRGDPEIAMLHVQEVMGGGVLSALVEHLGDITHRMSHLAHRNTVMGYEKVVKTLNWLSSSYGFEREMQENLASNARFRKVDPKALARAVSQALRAYAQAHAKLPVYNKAQWLARQAAVFVGLERFNDARACLRMLVAMCPNEAAFHEKALEFSRNPDGSLRQWSPTNRERNPPLHHGGAAR